MAVEWDDNDSHLVVDVLRRGTALCVSCVVRQAGVTKARVERIVAQFGETVQVTRDVVVCDGCLLTREVVRLA
jgi:hypothetical protein